MSSESCVSSSSRIRQFGLYRTIDARTEEFLRLSRKRQIRQGCACAAASTAITVTVVIVVYLVYEFSLNSETNLEHSLKSNWLRIMNVTAEESSFDPKLTNANIDITTLKLLPLLIKAIKKNEFLEKMLEDHSSPSYDKKDTTEHTETKMFPTNRFKMPTTKLFAMESRSYPVVYYRHPTKNIEYYTKVRKIRDYQRVSNYVDRMISDKVYIRSTKPMLKEEIHAETPPIDKYTPAQVTNKYTPYHHQTTTVSSNTIELKPKLNCKCPNKLGELLNKILTSIQKLFPENKTKKTRVECEKTTMTQSTQTNKLVPVQNVTENSIRFSNEKRTENTMKVNSTTETNINYILDRIYSPLNEKHFEQFTTTNINTEKKMYTQPTIKYINNYKNIIYRKKVLRNHESTSAKAMLEPIIGRIEYLDTLFTTPITNREGIKSIIINGTHTSNDNGFYFTKEHSKYVVDDYGTDNQNNNKIKTTIASNKISNFPRMSTSLTTNVVDSKIAIVKTKQNQAKANEKKDISNQNITNTDKKKVVTKQKSPIQGNAISEKLLLASPDSSKTVSSNKKLDEPKPDKIKTDKLNIYKKTSRYEPNTRHFDYSKNNKTIYHLISNDNKSFLSKQLLKTKKPPVLYNFINKPKGSHFSQLKNSNMVMYRMVQNKITTIMPKILTVLRKKKDKDLPLSHKRKSYNVVNIIANHELSAKPEDKYEKQGSDRAIKENVELFDEDVSEVMKQPEITIDKLDSNESDFKKQDDYDATWEDLKSENIPVLKSINPKQKPIYLGYYKNDLMNDERPDYEDTYNMNSISYDLNL